MERWFWLCWNCLRIHKLSNKLVLTKYYKVAQIKQPLALREKRKNTSFLFFLKFFHFCPRMPKKEPKNSKIEGKPAKFWRFFLSLPCWDKITVGFLFLNSKLKKNFLKKQIFSECNLEKYLKLPHIFFFTQQVWFEILIKNNFLFKSKKHVFSVILEIRAETNWCFAPNWAPHI